MLIARRMRFAAARMRLHAFVAVVKIIVGALFAPALGAWLLLERLVLPELLLRRGDQTEIMLGVLVIVLRRDRIAGCGRIARELDIFLGDMIGGAADLHIRPVGFVNPRQRIMTLAAVTSTHAMMLMLVLTVPHGSPVFDS